MVTLRYEFIDADYASPSVCVDGATPSIIRTCERLSTVTGSVCGSDTASDHGAGPAPPVSMYGRDGECAAIEGLLAGGRSGHSGVLVLHGEPGVGKSALLDFAYEAAGDMRALRCAGVESEMDLAFAGLHQLLRPVLDLAGRLPEPQAHALNAAFGLSARRAEDRFLIAVAVLSLLAEAAGDRPVLCLLDDAHWLDQASAESLAFVARRLEAEGVVILAASRRDAPAGVPELRVGGLDRASSIALLHSRVPDLPADVCDRLFEETGGNPLALVELAGSRPAQPGSSGPLPLTERVQSAFLDQVRGLPRRTQRLLLVAASDDTRSAALVLRAAQSLGVRPGALDAAERAGLIQLDQGGLLQFRHPLVRSAVYHAAPLTERLATHRALADASAGQADRQAWHRAASVLGTDESIAVALERSAGQARRRRGHAAASAAFERAAELSAAPSSRARRLAAAGHEAYDAGQLDRAAALVRQAEPLVGDVQGRAEVTALRGTIELARSSGMTALALLLEAAGQLAGHDPDRAVLILADATWAAESTCSARNVAEATARWAGLRLPAGHPLGPLVTAYLGFGDFYAGRLGTGLPRIREGLDGLLREARTGMARHLSRVGVLGDLAIAVGDDAAGRALATAAVEHCRSRGLVARLPFTLATLALVESHTGRLVTSRAHATEGLRLSTDLGQEYVACLCASLLSYVAAVHGHEEDYRRLAAEAVRLGGDGKFVTVVEFEPGRLGQLHLTLGRTEQALDLLLDTVGRLASGFPIADIHLVPDLVEAAVRAGEPERAAQPLARFERWAAHTGQPWADAVRHRCRALMATGDEEADEHYSAALRRHDEIGHHDRMFDRARTELLYGEWLRRARRRAKARLHLRQAHEIFERLGVTAWADRAAAELRATGQTPRRRVPSTARHLTPQELQVVRLAAAGGSNKDIAAHLFLSPRTVGYHLSNAFAKLGVTSRRELPRIDLGTPAAET
ncbi:AAA family ATPase [Actinomadura fulvescens]|uniref:LuxR family transcriptional regulator n=1 Tax=Actinomadura fulvescens TaxID=46160 RepID=A0ABP6BQE8_9ACTN